MKPNPFVRVVAAFAVLSSLLAAVPSEAGLFCWGDNCVARKEVKQRAKKEFEELKLTVEEERKDDPLLKTYVNHIEATNKRFDSQADAVLKQARYSDWEFDYMSQRVSKVLIPTIVKAVEASVSMPMDERKMAFAAVANEGGAAAADFDKQFIAENGPRMLASAARPDRRGRLPASEAADDLVQGAERLLGEDGIRGGGGGVWNKPVPTPEEMLKQSDVAKLAEDSANYVLKPTDDEPAPAPGTDNPGTGAGAGDAPAPRPRRRRGGVSGGSGGGLMDAIASPQGVAQLYATNGLQALRKGSFGEAMAMSQQALALDPENGSAMEVYQSVKGRGDALGASQSAMGAAGGGAFGASGFAGGGFGAAAAPSQEIAAAALSGAAKVASDQARAGAMNALKLGDARGALGILSKALSENPNNPALLNLRAQTHGRLGQWDEALKDAVAGLALAPGNVILLNTKALAENRSRRYRDALATSEQMIKADPRNAWGYANRAHAWAGLGNRDAMLADLKLAAALDPRFQRTLAEAETLQIPSDADVMFLFPGENAKAPAKAPAAAGRGRSFGVVAGAGLVGGLLLALGLLSTVMAPLKNTVVSVFTRAKRAGPATNAAVATAEPASVAGNVGGLIRGQYEISRQIGAGGMGMVYEGTDRSLGRRVAIKKMREELRLNPRERDRFIIEAKTVASLHHPNIVDIYAIAEEGEDVYLVFEYVDGKTVHDLVQLKGRLDPAESLRVTRAMGEALTYAHSRGVIHRDMKPSNVMMSGSGDIKVMDFGIARMAKDALTRYSMTNTVVGTPPYMAPEQEQGVVRKESDVYSLAICAYEMLTGKLPFIGVGAGMLMNKINMSYIPPSRNIAGLPEALDDVFLKAFQADPERRHRTPQEFVAELSNAMGGSRAAKAA